MEASLCWLASQTDENWLLVFDNADNVDLKLKNFLPSCSSGNVLITTRNRELRHYTAKDADTDVKAMDLEDAKKLLLVQARAERNDENIALAEAIVQVVIFTFSSTKTFVLTHLKELHCFALAVAQAGAFIHCHSSLSQYRELYRREHDNLLQNEETQGQDPYGLAVYSTWRLSYDKLDGPARLFLQICSLLHHEGISEEMFEKAALSQLNLEDSELQGAVTKLLNQLGKNSTGWSSWMFQKVIMRLGSHSLIEYDRQSGTYSIHPLVQNWSGTTMEGNRHDMQKLILAIIALSFSSTRTDENMKYRRKLLKHTINPLASLKLEDINPLVGTHIAQIYDEAGHFKETEALEVMAMEKMKLVLGDDHPKTLTSMDQLAGTYWEEGRWSDAEVLQVIVLEKRKLLLGDDHLDTLTSMEHLATTYMTQSRLSDAEALNLVVLEKRKQVLGDEHPDTFMAMGNLAAIYMSQGHWKEAEALLVAVVKKRKQVLGDDHPGTLVVMGNLEVAYRSQGRLKDAEVLGVMVMEKRKRLLGDEHPSTLTAMGNLANTYNKQGRLEDAEALELVVMEKRKQLLGNEHPDTLKTMLNLAVTYWKQGRWNDAEALQVVTMEKTKRLLGDNHIWTLDNMANLADTYRDQGHLNDAVALQEVVMEKRKQVLRVGHPDTLKSMSSLAAMYRSLGRINDAEALEIVLAEKTNQL